MQIMNCQRTEKGLLAQPLSYLFHFPERASHPSHKAPLALHIRFQIFCALPICLTNYWRIIKMLHYCTGGTVSAFHPGRYPFAHPYNTLSYYFGRIPFPLK